MVKAESVTQDTFQSVENVRALIRAGRTSEAAAACEQDLCIVSEGAEACLLKALLMRMGGRTNEALTAYDMALSFAPNAVHAYLGIAEILLEKGWLRSAMVVMENASQVANLHGEAKALLDRLAVQAGAARSSLAGAS